MRNQFFAGARGAGDHGDPVVRRHAPDAREDLQHLRTAADHAVESEAFEQPLVEFQRLAAQIGLVQNVGDPLPQRLGRKGLARQSHAPRADVFHG